MAKATVTEIDQYKEERLPVFFPRTRDNEEQNIFVGLNGKTYSIPRGRTVYVPRAVYDILAFSDRAQEITDEFDKRNNAFKE